MSITAFIGLAAVFFILGILFIVKGTSSQEDNAIPISSPEEIEELKSTFLPPEPKESPAAQEEMLPNTVSTNLTKDPGATSPIGLNQRSEINELTQKNKQLEEDFQVLKQENQEIKNSHLEAIKILEGKISSIQGEKEQLLTDHKLVDELKVKGELAEKRHAENKIQQDELRKFISTLESEMEELIRVQKLGADRYELRSLNNRLESSIATIESLKGENKGLQGFNQGLKNDFEKTKEHNALLVEKERFMEFELSKNRAQALGLEKICEDFKVQIETLTAVASSQ